MLNGRRLGDNLEVLEGRFPADGGAAPAAGEAFELSEEFGPAAEVGENIQTVSHTVGLDTLGLIAIESDFLPGTVAGDYIREGKVYVEEPPTNVDTAVYLILIEARDMALKNPMDTIDIPSLIENSGRIAA